MSEVAIVPSLTPYRNRLLVVPVDPERQTSAGIIIPESAQQKTGECVVIAVGQGSKDEPIDDVKVGDHILLAKYLGSDITFYDQENRKYNGIICTPSDILGIVR